jgi:acyl carrier protein
MVLSFMDAPVESVSQKPATSEDTRETIMRAIRVLLVHKGTPELSVEMNSDIYDDLGLDSLDVAELSATLEDDLGRDPYSEELAPRTAAEIAAFYES